MSRASIIAVGTEITTGDINNSNSQWLSKQLTDNGIEVVRHITVADHHARILSSIQICAEDSALVILTGGLGPTSDDFTREVVCSWLHLELEFDQRSWDQINERLRLRGVPVADSNKRQCFFPAQAHIYRNPAGTANAFSSKKGPVEIICLPGPPREIAAIWAEDLGQYIYSIYGTPNTDRLSRWHCLGLSESRLGEVVELALDGSGYTTGYRPHIPYVEVKVWTPSERSLENCAYLQKLDQTLQPWLAYRGDTDLATLLVSQLDRNASYLFMDNASIGVFTERLCKPLRSTALKHLSSRMTFVTGGAAPPGHFDHTVILDSHAGGWKVMIDDQNLEILYPWPLDDQTAQRLFQHCTEKTLLALATAWRIPILGPPT